MENLETMEKLQYTKHDVGVNIKEASLENTTDGLAAAFLLNAIHWPAVERLYDFNLLKVSWAQILSGKPAREKIPDFQMLRKMLVRGSILIQIETPLFVSCYGKK
jgi:hypothetical protein